MRYTVAVRALCEFTARRGDLALRFTPGPTAQEGIAGHQLVASRRGSTYEAELALSGDVDELTVRGRADGYDPGANRLEEIKTFRGELERMPANQRALHWAQLKMYGALLCRARNLVAVELALVYFDIASEREQLLIERHSAAELERFLVDQCRHFLAWARQELEHASARDQALAALRFPHPLYRQGQRELAEAVFKSVSTGRPLLAQAPTGIGKTVGTLFPVLKAWAPRRLDRLFFLTAKTPGRQLALDALQLLRDNGASPLRVVELVAREKACEHPDKACQGDSCPLARGFYDRLPAARAAAVAARSLDAAALRQVASEQLICPYWLGQEMARWGDVVVGDYNHFFDASALLHGLTLMRDWRAVVLVDEAHNLVERARGMYSAELDSRGWRRAARSAPAPIKRALNRIARVWAELDAGGDTPPADYLPLAKPPAALLTALQGFTAAVSDWLVQHPAPLDAALQQRFFDALHLCRIADLFEPDGFICDLRRMAQERSNSSPSGAGLFPGPEPAPDRSAGHAGLRLSLRNLVPAPLLAPRFAIAETAILFSATLTPFPYQRDLLGLPATTVALDVPAPFDPAQLTVTTVPLSTRYRDRAGSVHAIAALAARQYRHRPGNYLLFTSSYSHLEQLTRALAGAHPDIPLRLQAAQMSEAARQAFLNEFTETSRGIALAVLGGAFGEGVDLPGDRLYGAFIATLGLPQFNPVNEQLKQRMQRLFGDGWRYAYLYPGLQKVVQAAGRIIRSESDRGVLYLIDDRFNAPDVRSLLPAWWEITVDQPFSGSATISTPCSETETVSNIG